MSKKVSKKEDLVEVVVESVPNISKTKARQVLNVIKQQQVSIKSGPYPVPEDYERYHTIDPELTKLMKDMVKEEQAHQHEMDEKHLNKTFEMRKRGQWFALSIFTLVIILGGYSVYSGFEWGGALITALGVGGIVAQFLKN